MSERAVPPDEAASALLLLALLAAAYALAAPDGEGGPLAPCAAVVAFHGALLAPAIAPRARAAGGFLGLLLALPALAAGAYGRGSRALLSCLFVAAAACAAPRALAGPRAARAYLASMVLLFLAPFAAGYLLREFGDGASAGWVRGLSPLAAVHRTVASEGSAVPSILLLLTWPALALAWTGFSRRSS